MNVLIVDDQQPVIDSLKQEVDWGAIPVEKLYTANSAREARMVIRNFDVDVLLTDIEMPEEDGLSLFRWMRQEYPHIEGVFITAHADFQYAQEAIHMGGFDYILQPFREENVVATLRRVREKLNRERRMNRMLATPEQMRIRRSDLLDGLLRKLALNSVEEANRGFREFAEIEQAELGDAAIYLALLEIVSWKKVGHDRGEKMLPQFFTNVLEDIFEAVRGRVTLSSLEGNRYWMLLTGQRDSLSPEGFRSGIEEFDRFIRNNLEFRIAAYPGSAPQDSRFAESCRDILRRAESNAERRAGVFWDPAPESGKPEDADIVRQAKAYIARNLSRNISRGDVASEVHLTEEYFSRLFSRQTGFTFKDYLLNEKMNAAKKLLESSSLSISIVASKVGYDNYSHFSQIFKKVVGETPQDYRKNHQRGPERSRN